MKVLFVNNTQKACGVYQYGKRVANILAKDIRYELTYLETEAQVDFWVSQAQISPSIIVYNWHPTTMSWLTPSTTESLGEVKQLFVFHEFHYPNHLKKDGLLMSDLSDGENCYSLHRPIFELYLKKTENAIPKIGSFGFGFEFKGFERICLLVNQSFDEAIIHLHITNSFFGDPNGDISNSIIQRCEKLITKKDITLKVTTDFLSDEKLLEFLNSNTANVFLYDNLDGRGLSSTIDYAISVDVPLVINNSYMFRHILSERPEISIDNNSISDIISMGINPVLHFRKKWSNENMRDAFYKILQTIK
jgi:hypothetical protein